MINFRQILIMGVCWLAIVNIINYFFPSKHATEMVEAGNTIQVSKHANLSKPCVYEILTDENIENVKTAGQREVIDFGHTRYIFSDLGGGLIDSVYLPHNNDSAVLPIYNSAVISQPEDIPFFVAFNGVVSPIKYEKAFKKDEGDVIKIGYKAETQDLKILKTFTLFKGSSLVDLQVKAETKGEPIQMRIVLPQVDGEVADTPFYSVNINDKVQSLSSGGDTDKSVVAVCPPIMGVQTKYFTVALAQNYISPAIKRAYQTVYADSKKSLFLETDVVNGAYDYTMRAYVGPKDKSLIKKFDAKLVKVINSGWFGWLSDIMMYILNFLYSLIHNYGFAIILLALILQLFIIPLRYFFRNSNEKRVEFKHEYEHLKVKYRNDPERFKVEQMALIKKYGVLPGGGFYLVTIFELITMFAVTSLLRNSVFFYKAPFIGWLNDLSGVDCYYILPGILAVTLYLQLSAKARTAKHRMWMMLLAALAGALFSHLAVGLLLFIAVRMLFNVLLQKTGISWLQNPQMS